MNTLHHAHWPPAQPKEIRLPATSLYANLEVSALRYPDKPATIFYGSAMTYAQLRDRAERLAGFLQQRCGVAKGDRVLLHMQNSPQWIVAFYAILRADAVVVPVSPALVTDELRHVATDAGAGVAVTAQELWPRVAPLAGGPLARAVVATYSDALDASADPEAPDFVRAPRSVPQAPGVTPWSDALAADLAPGPHRAGPPDLAVLPYTSGTTGKPKGCMHTHRSAMHTAIAGQAWIGTLTADGISLASLPFFHVTGMQSVMNGAIYTGHTLVPLTRWDRDAAGRLITRHRVTGWCAISTMVVDFLANPRLPEYDLSSLRIITGGGAAMPAAVAEKLRALTGLEYVEGYGLTETMAPSHVNPLHRPKRACLGIPIYGTDARVIDPETRRELPPGEKGEIVIHGPQVFLGYWNDAQKTADAFLDLDGKRFFRTGDLGHVDEEGYFFISDRLKRMINASGMKVWPAEVEGILYGHPAIQEACVIASPDAYRGETVKAVVVLRPGARATAEEIASWCRERMAAYKIPRLFAFVDTLPKSPTGKVAWRALQEREKFVAAGTDHG
ncbi:MAG TPA: long-chain fatty acid--CoA ligase, partial [Anaeromyxobacter sp.]|nr:long-chain fatty acid--CoA ligase [Anaeromyxobacter sp.]